MKSGIGMGMTRIDHINVSDQLYANYAMGQYSCVWGVEDDDYTFFGFTDKFVVQCVAPGTVLSPRYLQALFVAGRLLRIFLTVLLIISHS